MQDLRQKFVVDLVIQPFIHLFSCVTITRDKIKLCKSSFDLSKVQILILENFGKKPGSTRVFYWETRKNPKPGFSDGSG